MRIQPALIVIALGWLPGTAPAQPAAPALLDQDGRPVAGAWVVATREECRGIGHCNSYCEEVRVAQTDAAGRYRFEGLSQPLRNYSLDAYREGYQRVPGPLNLKRGATDFRTAHLGPVDGRIASLSLQASHMACSRAPDDQRRALIPVYRAMLREALALARLPEQQKEARKLCESLGFTQKALPGGRGATPKETSSYLKEIEPACLASVDDAREQRILEAIRTEDPEPIRAEAREGFDFNRRLKSNRTLMAMAAEKGSARMVTELVAAGARVDELGAGDATALEVVVATPHLPADRRLAAVRALLEAGANPNRRDVHGTPIVFRLAQNQLVPDLALVKLLLERGARPDLPVACTNHCSLDGSTALHVALVPELARLLIEAGANVNARTAQGDTPLHRTNRPAIVRMLLQRGADPNAVSAGGYTPLMLALASHDLASAEWLAGERERAELLVSAGARLDARDGKGRQALAYTTNRALQDNLRARAAAPPTTR